MKNIRSAKNSTLLLMVYCLLMSVFLTFLGYAIDSGNVIAEGPMSKLLESINPELKTAAYCNYLLLGESIVALVTLIRRCANYRIYQVAAIFFILVRLAAVGSTVYEGSLAGQSHPKEPLQLWRARLYATVLGVFEIMIVVLQMGMLSKLYKKLTAATKEETELV